jgi:prolyl oligopeptidase PreP (S9A serine peptidase family)
MDMLRYQNFTIGWAWATDYGTARTARDVQGPAGLLAAAQHQERRELPGVLVTTGDHDDRVVPAHSFKYAATLQAADTGPAPKLIRIETNAGHGAGKPPRSSRSAATSCLHRPHDEAGSEVSTAAACDLASPTPTPCWPCTST